MVRIFNCIIITVLIDQSDTNAFISIWWAKKDEKRAKILQAKWKERD